jgi:ssDNA-binding Zn-finger/Zn-ribbon topoisomerase 1
MNELQVPYGLEPSGRLIKAAHAEKSISYSCPACLSQLVLRAGEVNVRHFGHRADGSCSSESIIHKTAKKLLEQAISDNAVGINNKLQIQCWCPECGAEHAPHIPINTFTAAKQEVAIGTFICDVVAYKETDIALALEVLHSHKVSTPKAQNLSVHWAELRAEDVVANPYFWRPVQERLKKITCTSCKDTRKNIHRIASKWGIEQSLYSIPRAPNNANYIIAVDTCFKCKEQIPVFWWRGVPFCQIEPPTPRPKTIKYKESKQYGGSYWANTCPNCKIIQGDNHIFLSADAPLHGLPLTNMEQHTKGMAKTESNPMYDVIRRITGVR